jgi:hypothetical protein
MRAILLLGLFGCGTAAPEADLPYERATIDWKQADRWARLPAERVAPLSAAIAKVDLPVLLPAEAPLASGTFTSGPGWYALAMHTDAYDVLISGTRIVFDDDVPAGLTPPTRDDWSITRIDGIAELTFVDMGAAYTLDLECKHPATNPTCAEDATLERIARSLALAGGAR